MPNPAASPRRPSFTGHDPPHHNSEEGEACRRAAATRSMPAMTNAASEARSIRRFSLRHRRKAWSTARPPVPSTTMVPQREYDSGNRRSTRSLASNRRRSTNPNRLRPAAAASPLAWSSTEEDMRGGRGSGQSLGQRRRGEIRLRRSFTQAPLAIGHWAANAARCRVAGRPGTPAGRCCAPRRCRKLLGQQGPNPQPCNRIENLYIASALRQGSRCKSGAVPQLLPRTNVQEATGGILVGPLGRRTSR